LDKILVLEQGRVAEFGTPKQLLLDENSVFSSMVDELGNEAKNALIAQLK